MRLTRETTAPEGADDGAPTLAVVDARVHEAADATLDFAVSLSRAASGTVTVDYATSDGSATAGADYTAASGTLTFAAGETEKTVSVPVLDDSIDEGEETFTLRLSNATGAHIADGGSVTRHRASPSRARARTLIAHEASGFEEWGRAPPCASTRAPRATGSRSPSSSTAIGTSSSARRRRGAGSQSRRNGAANGTVDARALRR